MLTGNVGNITKMIVTITHTSIYKISSYGKHLKNLSTEDRISRFGYQISDFNIDKLILNVCYAPEEHELWYAEVQGIRVGWGHMAKNSDDSWELAVSVDKDYQRKGIGDRLISEMIIWAKCHHVNEIYMHCIEDNKVIQHLADKHDLKTRYRDSAERTSSLEVPSPTLLEAAGQKFKEQREIISKIGFLQKQLTKLWLTI